jgi:hypothetical protein
MHGPRLAMTWMCSRQPKSSRVARRVTSCCAIRDSRGSSPAAARLVQCRSSRAVRRHPTRSRMPPRSHLGRSPSRRSRRCRSPSPSRGPVPRTRAIPRHRHRLRSTERHDGTLGSRDRTGTTPTLPHGAPASFSARRRRFLMRRRRQFFCTQTNRRASSAHARDLDEARSPTRTQLGLVALAAAEQRTPER